MSSAGFIALHFQTAMSFIFTNYFHFFTFAPALRIAFVRLRYFIFHSTSFNLFDIISNVSKISFCVGNSP